jgi:hypothetical protein
MMIVLSVLVALSLILSLLGPLLLRETTSATPTPALPTVLPPTVGPTATATDSALSLRVGADQDAG